MPTSSAAPVAAGAPDAPGRAPAFVELLAGFRVLLEASLAELLAGKRTAALAQADDARLELIDGVGHLAALGGKRLRPAFVWFTYRAAGGAQPAEALPLALATELLHTYLLIHDDLMDHADVRRGAPSAHVRFRDAHRLRGLAGDAGDFGASVGILLGDLAQTWAVELASTLAIEGGRRRELLACFSAMCEEVISGQYSELLVAARRDRAALVREEELLHVLRMKSGRYTAERPIQLGAILAGAPPRLTAALCRYGQAVGEAFQLQDDLLGTFGDPAATGKPVEADLKEGKLTFLVFHALRAASPADRAKIAAALGDHDLDAERAQVVQGLFERTGARARVEAMIEERLAEAHDAIDGLDLAPEGRTFFAGLLDHLRGRER
ncbi:MAG TPA: polyprenyl synthetase family protein [Thermoanaerobaculia bacterium]|nr:polyprenyl synthetase family protein [Thermoanaerobaculia bacterium]